MNKAILVFSLIFLLACTPQKSIKPSPLLGTLKMKNIEIPVLLEDANYDQELKDFIFTDLKKIFWYAKAAIYESKDRQRWQKREILGEQYISKKTIQTNAYVPKVFKDLEYSYTINYQNKDHMVIPTKLTEKYRERMIFVKKHQEMFDKLEEFCESLNKTNANAMSREEILELSHFFKKTSHVKEHLESLSLEELREDVDKGIFGFTYHLRSAFDTDTYEKNNTSNQITYKSHFIQIKGDKIINPIIAWSLIYSQEKWKILIL